MAVAVATLCLAPIGIAVAKEKKTKSEDKESSGADPGGHIQTALALVDQRQFEPAIAEFTLALEANPANALAIYQNRGAMYLAVGKYAEALADYTKASELKPDDERSYLGKGQAETYLGKWDEAIADLSKAAELKPDDADAYGFRGFAYSKLNSWANALTRLRQIPGRQTYRSGRTRATRRGQSLPAEIARSDH